MSQLFVIVTCIIVIVVSLYSFFKLEKLHSKSERFSFARAFLCTMVIGLLLVLLLNVLQFIGLGDAEKLGLLEKVIDTFYVLGFGTVALYFTKTATR